MKTRIMVAIKQFFLSTALHTQVMTAQASITQTVTTDSCNDIMEKYNTLYQKHEELIKAYSEIYGCCCNQAALLDESMNTTATMSEMIINLIQDMVFMVITNPDVSMKDAVRNRTIEYLSTLSNITASAGIDVVEPVITSAELRQFYGDIDSMRKKINERVSGENLNVQSTYEQFVSNPKKRMIEKVVIAVVPADTFSTYESPVPDDDADRIYRCVHARVDIDDNTLKTLSGQDDNIKALFTAKSLTQAHNLLKTFDSNVIEFIDNTWNFKIKNLRLFKDMVGERDADNQAGMSDDTYV